MLWRTVVVTIAVVHHCCGRTYLYGEELQLRRETNMWRQSNAVDEAEHTYSESQPSLGRMPLLWTRVTTRAKGQRLRSRTTLCYGDHLEKVAVRLIPKPHRQGPV